MKKSIFLYSFLIVIGIVLECLHFCTDITFFGRGVGVLGIICTIPGVIGLIWHLVIPTFDKKNAEHN